MNLEPSRNTFYTHPSNRQILVLYPERKPFSSAPPNHLYLHLSDLPV